MVNAQAFCQARYKISAVVFGDVNRKLMALVDEHLPVPRRQGLRIVASDSAAVRLPVAEWIDTVTDFLCFAPDDASHLGNGGRPSSG
jgi:hypothetical protein